MSCKLDSLLEQQVCTDDTLGITGAPFPVQNIPVQELFCCLNASVRWFPDGYFTAKKYGYVNISVCLSVC